MRPPGASTVLRRLFDVRETEVLEGAGRGNGAVQLSFFQLDDPTLSAIRDYLKDADLNNMTPMQAFDLLRKMKQELGL